MPRATLSFHLPEEEDQFRAAQEGEGWKHLMLDILNHLKSQIKHADIPEAKKAAFEEVRELIWNSIDDRKLKAD